MFEVYETVKINVYTSMCVQNYSPQNMGTGGENLPAISVLQYITVLQNIHIFTIHV